MSPRRPPRYTEVASGRPAPALAPAPGEAGTGTGTSSTTAPTARERALLERYVDAHGCSDPAALAGLLRDDVRLTMPLW